jgi:hypothetical protein
VVDLLSAPPRLRVVSRGQRHFVQVLLGWAGSLRGYLGSRGVASRPLGSLVGGLEVVELGAGADPAAVQSLLDRWDGGA